MPNEDRIKALGTRVKQHPESDETMQTPTLLPVQKKTRQSDRSRHTFYLDTRIVKQLDQAFKDAAHELYPQEVEKADYLEACLTFALAHQEEIKASLADNTQS